jgi:hypothetical protein
MEKLPTFTVGNRKLGKTIKTWSRPWGDTCPAECPFLKKNCYAAPARGMFAQAGNRGAIARLGHIPPIERLKAHHVLRLHVVGDFGQPSGRADLTYIRGVAAAAAQSAATVYTYTHGWRRWGRALARLRDRIQINASCDTARDVRDAVRRGWRVAFHSPSVDLGATYHYEAGERLLVCPAQRRAEITCETCGACWGASKRYAGVAFRDH